MNRIQPRSAAIGVIFRYPNPANRNAISDWLSERGFSVTEASPRQLTLGGSDVQIGEAMHAPPKVAERNGIEILYNPEATLDGFGNSSFITIRDGQRGDLEQVLEATEEIFPLMQDLGIQDQIALYELTYDSAIRVTDNHDVTQFYSDESLDKVGSVQNQPIHALTARFRSDTEPDEPGWFKLLFDSGALKNPQLWRSNLQKRFESYEDISTQNVKQILEETVDIATE